MNGLLNVEEKDPFTEPGRKVGERGNIVYSWPPEGRFAELWERVEKTFPDEVEREEVADLLARAQQEI